MPEQEEGGMTDEESKVTVAKWAFAENVVIVLVTAVLFYATRSPWCFLCLLFVNIIRAKPCKKGETA